MFVYDTITEKLQRCMTGYLNVRWKVRPNGTKSV